MWLDVVSQFNLSRDGPYKWLASHSRVHHRQNPTPDSSAILPRSTIFYPILPYPFSLHNWFPGNAWNGIGIFVAWHVVMANGVAHIYF